MKRNTTLGDVPVIEATTIEDWFDQVVTPGARLVIWWDRDALHQPVTGETENQGQEEWEQADHFRDDRLSELGIPQREMEPVLSGLQREILQAMRALKAFDEIEESDCQTNRSKNRGEC